MNIPICNGTNIFNTRYVFPYPVIERVSELAYRSELSAHFGTHNLFHVDRLNPRRCVPGFPTIFAPADLPSASSQTSFEAEIILYYRDVTWGRTIDVILDGLEWLFSI